MWVGVLLGAAAIAAAGASGRLPSGYRPPRLTPMVMPRGPGDGIWRTVGEPVYGAPPVLVTTLRLGRNPWDVAYVAWIDHTRARLALYPGTAQPPSSLPRGPSEIPLAQRWRLIATFNGGFKYGSGSGGGGGFSVDGHTYVPLERGLGTLVAYRDGRVDIVAWRGGLVPVPAVVFARQDLHLLVDAGRPAPNLGSQAMWGWVFGGGSTTWRTGIGVDRHGNLIYVAAVDTTAGLAALLIHAGAVRAIELDMNPEWPTFDTYAHRNGLRPSQFVPNYQQSVSRYLSPDSRDFFAVYRPLPGRPVRVPFH